MSETLLPPNNQEIVIDDSLTLRALSLGQAEELFSLTEANRDYLGEWLPWVDKTRSVEDSAGFISSIIQNRAAGTELGFGIVLEDKVVGHISLMHIDDDREPEIGYWVSKDCAGQGVTTKAATAVSDFAFHTLGLDKVIIRADPNNIGSNRVAEKLGYTLERQDPHAVEGVMNIWVKSANE
jgi:ribosomal-protein-serine acetyltransferase